MREHETLRDIIDAMRLYETLPGRYAMKSQGIILEISMVEELIYPMSFMVYWL